MAFVHIVAYLTPFPPGWGKYPWATRLDTTHAGTAASRNPALGHHAVPPTPAPWPEKAHPVQDVPPPLDSILHAGHLSSLPHTGRFPKKGVCFVIVILFCVVLLECEYFDVNILEYIKNPNEYELLDFGLFYFDVKWYIIIVFS
jgi:hypothetical protein